MASVVAVALPGRGLLRILGLAFGIAVVVGETALIYLVWGGVGIFILMVANTLAELATAIPKAGGPYVYVRRAFGDYLGLVSGWGSVAVQVFAVGYLALAS